MTNIVADVANYYNGNNENIGAGGSVATAKKGTGVEVETDKQWDGSFNQ